MGPILRTSPHLLGAPPRQLPSPAQLNSSHPRYTRHGAACVSAQLHASQIHTRITNPGYFNGQQQRVTRRAQLFLTRKAAAVDDIQTPVRPHLVLYSKPGCHLCEGLKEKLDGLFERAKYQDSVLTGATLEVRDITTREDWDAAYGMQIPVLAFIDSGVEREIPRPPPRMPADRLERHIVAALVNN